MKYAELQNGKLLSTNELKEYAIKYGPFIKGVKAWAATNDNNWVVVGENAKWEVHEPLG